MRDRERERDSMARVDRGKKTEVVIVGAGPSGLAVAACLSLYSIRSVILERDDCHSSLWKKRVYDRVKLHLAKQFCELPHMPHSSSTSTFMSRDHFVKYLDDYVYTFDLKPRFSKSVESATFDVDRRIWITSARDIVTGEMEEHWSRFLVVATGENAEGVIPDYPGMSSFSGKIIHSGEYKSAVDLAGKRVLVVGSGNSGMEIAYDLCENGAQTSISVRGPFHVLTKEMVHAGMLMLKQFSIQTVDAVILFMSRFRFGDLSRYGIIRPKEGPFFLKTKTGRSPVIDVGTLRKIKNGEIKVMKGVAAIADKKVWFVDGRMGSFDAIIFATGYRSSAGDWLKVRDIDFQDGRGLLDENGFPKRPYPDHWEGGNGLFFAGLSKRGLAGVSMDAEKIAEEIKGHQGIQAAPPSET